MDAPLSKSSDGGNEDKEEGKADELTEQPWRKDRELHYKHGGRR